MAVPRWCESVRSDKDNKRSLLYTREKNSIFTIKKSIRAAMLWYAKQSPSRERTRTSKTSSRDSFFFADYGTQTRWWCSAQHTMRLKHPPVLSLYFALIISRAILSCNYGRFECQHLFLCAVHSRAFFSDDDYDDFVSHKRDELWTLTHSHSSSSDRKSRCTYSAFCG